MNCDVLIIGAGVSGLTSSAILQKKGYSICLLEKNDTIFSNAGKYDITEGNRIDSILHKLEIKPNKINNVSEWKSKNHSYLLTSEIQDFYFKRGLGSNSLESQLYSKINKDNISIFFKSRINKIITKDNRIIEIKINSYGNDYSITPKYVIIADGSDSYTREKLEIDKEIYATFLGYGLIINNEGNQEPHTKIDFNVDYAPGGYVYSGSVEFESFYCIVIDEETGKMGLLRNYLDNYVKDNINGKFKIINYFKGKGISGFINNHIINAFFVGGSALLNDPFLGYGLNYAVESSYQASNAIIENNPDRYQQYLSEVHDDFSNMLHARKIWRNASNDFFDELIQVLNGEKNSKNPDIKNIISYFLE
jgi:flavin-dependent dehydrogenase